MRPSAATRSRIGWSVALLGECQRGSSKRKPDCEAQSFHGDHLVFSYQNDKATTPGAGAGFPPSPERSRQRDGPLCDAQIVAHCQIVAHWQIVAHCMGLCASRLNPSQLIACVS
jgi:hypothetical protein